jgi:phenylacetic acid degradation operon negative regulatory protein
MSKIKRTKGRGHTKIQARFSTVIYTLFGAFIVPRGGKVHVASLIDLVFPLGFSPNAIRLGLSRMARQGVFDIKKSGRRSYYSLNVKGMKWMEQGRVRAFEVKRRKWDGRWRLVVYNFPETMRDLRDKLRCKLQSLGYANVSASFWISPYDLQAELSRYMEEKSMLDYVETFTADYTGKRRDKELAATVWRIDDLTRQYRIFMRKYEKLISAYNRSAKSERPMDLADCFARRFCMTAEYVALRLADPMLPSELLPENWAGIQAEGIYDDLLRLLKPRADAFVDSVLSE